MMASKDFSMRRYSFRAGDTWLSRVVDCAGQFRRRYGSVPTVAHISLLATEAPASIGLVHIEQAWGLQPCEMDLGPVPEPAVPPVEMARVG